MKKYILVFISFMVLVQIFYNDSSNATGPLVGKTFILDAGHGGVDPGSVVGNVKEKDINLKITLKLKEKLNQKGAKVILIRDGDYDLATPKATFRKKSDFDHRISLINESKADYYLSIHLNYLDDSKYYGPQVFYSPIIKENELIAREVQSYLNDKLNTNRDAKKISKNIYMYSKLNVKGVLIECGFLSNSLERNNLQNDEYIDKFTLFLAEVFLNI